MPTASVPGKLILLGEHAAVYGRPALVAAVGLRLRAAVRPGRPGTGPGVRIRLPESGAEASLSWPRVLETARRAREAWERYEREPGPVTFAALAAPVSAPARADAGDASLRLLELALGEAARELGEEDPGRLNPVELEVASAIPVGSGFGSSAAAAVGVAMAYLAFRGAACDAERLQRVSLEVERRQHGSPSGIDNATVIHGGILEARRLPSGEVALERVPVRSRLLERLRVVGSGRPAEATGAVVAAVRALRDREPARVEGVLDRLAELTGRLRAELDRAEERPAAAVEILRQAEAGLEELGVVPAPVCELIRRVEAEGGAAKVSGAGSLAGPGAGNLIVYHPEPERIERWGFLAGCRRYRLELGVPGARLEDSAAAGDAVELAGREKAIAGPAAEGTS
jgi:mevalonate kinase